ncbi:MAG: Rh-like protein/ammonium transporter [Monoraphidium minutum]|nr:MAG: Rh-like protein/ammonium transporter [Monoraphidium minutum]
MVFVGFGFLMTFLRRYGFSAVGLNFFMSAIAMVEALVVLGAIHHLWHEHLGSIRLDLPLLIEAAFCAASAMIAFGAVLGKTTPTELCWIIVAMVPLYGLNQYLVFNVIKGVDVGGSMTIHAFGAYYGLAASLAISSRQSDYTSANTKNSASYISNIFSMIGTLFLWIYWPSFNGALASVTAAEHGEPTTDAAAAAQQYFCIVNTLLSLLGSCVSTFVMSVLINNRFDMMHVQNATLAGGVAVGSAAALNLHPAGALAVGAAAGVLSTAGFAFLSPLLERSVGLGDTCGVHNLHGMPGILGGLVAGLAAFGASNAAAAPHGAAQFGWQVLAIVATLAIASAGGGAAGWAASRANPFSQLIDGAHLFDDGLCWTEVDLELSNKDSSVVGIPSVHGGDAYEQHKAAKGAASPKDTAAADQQV